jgi:hypothetical protein
MSKPNLHSFSQIGTLSQTLSRAKPKPIVLPGFAIDCAPFSMPTPKAKAKMNNINLQARTGDPQTAATKHNESRRQDSASTTTVTTNQESTSKPPDSQTRAIQTRDSWSKPRLPEPRYESPSTTQVGSGLSKDGKLTLRDLRWNVPVSMM